MEVALALPALRELGAEDSVPTKSPLLLGVEGGPPPQRRCCTSRGLAGGEERKPLNKPSCTSLLAALRASVTPVLGGLVCCLGQIFRKRRCLVPPKAFQHLSGARDLPILPHMAVIYFPGSKVFPRAPAHLPLLTNRSAPCTAIPTVRSEISSAQRFGNVWLPFPCLCSYYRPRPHPSFPTLLQQCSFLRSG